MVAYALATSVLALGTDWLDVSIAAVSSSATSTDSPLRSRRAFSLNIPWRAERSSLLCLRSLVNAAGGAGPPIALPSTTSSSGVELSELRELELTPPTIGKPRACLPTLALAFCR
eukprot:CAMPEP_0174739626 /NCGR_PEP_ID=MMETSP1094-20130205/71916_1 /TAXON_ID=156173 /ORGANISM="Chrysochromulina brevifilum, Strain UTEX LB 985" /LENGTH=114 /DNA_ID=CAMNT_0015943209 /DNA_START=206 /DNA_END=547 /DNA_ORIENTATION=+